MNKRVSFGPRPDRNETTSPTPDEWVANRGIAAVEENKTKMPMKRLTIDVPADLHRRIKVGCALKGSNIADELRELLEQHFPDEGASAEPPS
jgi:hypothetical protein